MIEKVARAICYTYGSRMCGPGMHIASREIGWKGDGQHIDDYVNRHWHEWENEARFAIEAMREPTKEMVQRGFDEPRGEMDWLKAIATSWRAMIDEALRTDPDAAP